MEEKREIIYSDLSSASRKQPYDAMVYLEGDQVVAIDGNGKIIAKGVAGTDDVVVIMAVINNQKCNDIHFSNGIFQLTAPIIITRSNVSLTGHNTTLRLANEYHGYSPRSRRYMGIDVGTDNVTPDSEEISGIVIDSLTLDGNKQNQTQSYEIGIIGVGRYAKSCFIRNCTFLNAYGKALTIYAPPNGRCDVTDCTFKNNCIPGNNCDVFYVNVNSDTSSYATFTNCAFTRDTYDASITSQAFYMNHGTVSYRNITAKNISGPVFDFRYGNHDVDGFYIEHCRTALSASLSTPPAVNVTFKNGTAYDCVGEPGVMTGPCWIADGTGVIENVRLIQSEKTASCNTGIRVRDDTQTIGTWKIRNCVIKGFLNFGLMFSPTISSPQIVEYCKIDDCDMGISFPINQPDLLNLAKTLLKNNVITNCRIPVYDQYGDNYSDVSDEDFTWRRES